MLKKLKKKFTDFFEGYFVEILKQQEIAKNEIDWCNKRILQLEKELLQLEEEFLQVKSGQQSVYNQIVTTEKNLNYYGMIRSIMDENTYVGHELNFLSLQKTDFPKILIAGFYGADNFGDEIMLQTLLSAFPEEMLPSITVMLCDNPSYDYFHLPGVNFIHIPKKTFECNLLAQHFDVLIWGGGALIDDGYYDYGPMELNNLYLALSERFIAFKKKVISLGLSTNQEFTHPEFCVRLKNVVNRSTYFSLRDTNSIAVLKKLGIENVDYLDDIVFFHKIWKEHLPEKTTNDIPTIGIIWICCEETEALLIQFLKKIRESYGDSCNIRLIPFYNHVQNDKNFYSSVLEKFGNDERITIVSYTNQIDKMISEISACDFMVNMRYHGMLLCGLLGKPMFNICYDIHRHYVNKIDFLADVLQTKDGVKNFSELIKNLDKITLGFVKPCRGATELAKPCKELTDLILSKIK